MTDDRMALLNRIDELEAKLVWTRVRASRQKNRAELWRVRCFHALGDVRDLRSRYEHRPVLNKGRR